MLFKKLKGNIYGQFQNGGRLKRRWIAKIVDIALDVSWNEIGCKFTIGNSCFICQDFAKVKFNFSINPYAKFALLQLKL